MAKTKELDITKTGPVGYKSLQAQNNSQFDDIDKFISESQSRILSRASQSDPYRDMQQMVQSSLSTTDTPWGESMFDNKTANQADFENLGDVRAENQPWYAQIGAGLAKGVVLAGTTFLDGTLGLVFGVGTAIGEDRWSGLWDNEFSKAMQSINEWSEQALPNYYTKAEQEQPWYENIFTANFLGDKFIKNLGFTVGAFYGGGVTAAGARGLGKLTMLGAKRLGASVKTLKGISKSSSIVASGLGSVTSAVNEGRIEALNNSKDWFELHKAQLDDNLRERLAAIQAEYEANAGKQLVRSGAEGNQFVDPAYVKYQKAIAKEREAYNAALGKLSEDRLKMGNADLLMNIPILTASNIIQFGKLYANGFNTARKSVNIVGKAGKYTAGTTRLGAAYNITKGALSEGTEEISQKAASVISGNYYSTDVNNFYKSKIDPEAAQETLSWTKAFAEGINETVNDGSSWEEFFIGSLTGALGMPRFRGIRNAEGRFQSPITLEGGAVNEWREYNAKIARENEIANYMNSRINSPKFENYYQGLVRHNKYQKDMNRAAEEGNAFDFKNAEHAQLVSDIIMFDNAGKIEDLKAAINEASGTSQKDLESAVVNTTSKDKNGDLIGPFSQYASEDENGNIIANFGTEQAVNDMASKINENKKNILDTIKEYQDIKDELILKTGQQLSDDQLEELTWMKSQINNWFERATAMSGEVKSTIGDVLGNLDALLRFKEQVRDFEGTQVRRDDKGNIDASLSERYLQTDKNVRDIQGAINTLNLVRSHDDKTLTYTLATSPKFVGGLIKEINEIDENVLSADKKEDITTKLNDIVKLGNASKTYNAKLKEYLENPQKQAEDHAKADEQAVQEEVKEKTNSIKSKLNSATSLNEFRAVVDENLDNIENVNDVLDELENEGSEMAKNYRETSQYNNEVRRVLNESDAEPQVKQDAMKLLQDQFSNSENLEQLANPNSIYINNANAFDEDSNGDVELSATRFQEAQYALQNAMSKVNNDNKFKDRFSSEYKKPVEKREGAVRGDDRTTTGDSGTSTIPAVISSEGLPTVELPTGNITHEMVAEENKKANEDSETPQKPSKDAYYQFYRPSIPELHIEASKEGDFRPFDIVVSKRENGADFSDIYSYLRDSGAFRYVNEGNLKVSDELGFMIDPEFEKKVEGKEWHKAPTIFLIDKRNNQVVGSLDESDYSVSRYEGLKGLEEKIIEEYNQVSQTSQSSESNDRNEYGYKGENKLRDYKESNNYTNANARKIIANYNAFFDILETNPNLSLEEYKAKVDDKLSEDAYKLWKWIQSNLNNHSDNKNEAKITTKPTPDEIKDFIVEETIRYYRDELKSPLSEEAINTMRNTPLSGLYTTTTAKQLLSIPSFKERVDNFAKGKPSKTGGKFIATPTTRVSKVMIGKIPYGNTERSLKDIPNVSSTDREPIFGIIKNGVLVTNNAKIDNNSIIKPLDMSNEGRLYLLIPTGAGKYSPAAVRVKHFNKEEFNLDDVLVGSTPIGEDIKDAITKLSNAISQDDVSLAMQDLAQALYMQDIIVTWFNGKTGDGIVISKKVRKSDGTYEKVTINGKEQIKEDKYDIYFSSKSSVRTIGKINLETGKSESNNVDDSVVYKDANKIYNEILEHLIKFNLPLQVSTGRINKEGYNKKLIDSNILTSNITDASVKGTWFTTDYFDNEGNLHQAINPASVTPKPKRKIETPVGGTEGAIAGTRIVSVFSNKPYYIDLKTNTIRNDQGRTVEVTDSNRILFDLAWAQDNFGDSTNSSMMVNNKVLTPDGKVLDRSKQVYLSGQEAQDVKDTIAGRKKEREDRIAKSKKVIGEIYENQKRVDKTKTDEEFYYVLEEDGEYHKYSRVHSRLGSNWVESPKQSKDLKDIKVQLSKLVMASPKGYNDYLDSLSKKFNIDLSQYHDKMGIKDRQAVLNIIRDKMSGINSQRALEAGSAVDSIIRQYFTIKDVSKIVRPSNMSESAFIDLITTLNEVKSNMEQMGERFLADNIVLFQKYSDDTRVAGEVDILSVDKNGNFKIYDVKTRRYSFYSKGGLNLFDWTINGSKATKEEVQNYINRNFKKPFTLYSNMSDKDYYTLQLSAYKNLFESQYGVPVTKLAIMPFVLGYDNDKVSSVQSEKGIPITYNPAVNVPLVGNVKVDKPIEPPTTPAQAQTVLPIFDTSLEIQNPIDRVLPENSLGKDSIVGYYEKGGKLYRGLIKKAGEIEGVPIYITKERDKGFGRKGEINESSSYFVIFPNGKFVDTGTLSKSDEEAFNAIMKALSIKPQKVKDMSNEKTILFNPNEVPIVSATPITTEETPATINQGITLTGAAFTGQKEREINDHDEEFEDELTLRRVDDTKVTVWNQEEELNWLNKVLPQLSKNDRVKVVKGLIKVGKSGAVAWGQFDKGVITLSDIAAEGTAYHEAFHVVFNLLLDQNERISLLNEYRGKHPNMDNLSLEEELAEDFREFVMQGGKDTRSLGRKIIDFFKSLFIKIKYWKDFRPSSIYYFRAINEGKYSEKDIPVTTLSEDRYRQEEYTQEMKDILSKAPRDSQGRLLAPNGNPTNLTERQWLQVRTKEFKNWFGDWENDPDNASKVIDENGEPLVVYHGTTQDFTTFSKDKLGSFTHAASAKLAFFATSNENLAKDIYAELEDNEHFYKRMLAVDSNFSREDLGIVPEDDPKDEIYSEYINNYDNLKYEYKDVIEEANKLITYKSSTKEITISKALEWVEDKDISDYEKEGFIISDKQLADYKEGKEITISKPIKVSDGGTLEERIAKLNTPRSKEYLKELKELENIRDKELIELEEKLKHVYNSKVKALFLNIRNPKIDSDNGHKYRAESYLKRIQKAINNNDGGIIKDTRDPYLANIYYFFEPNQVKSATDNIGTFSTTNDDIRYRVVPNSSSEVPRVKRLWHTSDEIIYKFNKEMPNGYFAQHGGSPRAIFFADRAPESQSFLSQRKYKTQYDVVMENPYIVENLTAGKYNQDAKHNSMQEAIQYALDNGYDSVIFKDLYDNMMYGDIYVVFDPKQVNYIVGQDNTGRDYGPNKFKDLPKEVWKTLVKKGWTEEQWNRISQEERNQAIKCIAF